VHFMKGTQNKWIYLTILSIVWGSSFILIKKGLDGLTPLQLGSLRILFGAVFLLLIGFRSLKKISRKDWKWLVVTAFIGTFIPAFLFAFAETEIDSGITSLLNSTTPIMALILGATFFAIGFSANQLVGVIVGLIGSVLLIWSGSDVNPDQNYWYSGLVLLSSVCYAFNVNIIKKHLQELPAVAIAAGNFAVLVVPAFVVLLFSDFFTEETLAAKETHVALGYIVLLAVVGTGIAKILFNKLVQISAPVFATSVTYTIPIIALFWGLLDGEHFTVLQLGAAGVILLGVVLSNRN
jgi:drug/metabolite transporter (DMT)-like permease